MKSEWKDKRERQSQLLYFPRVTKYEIECCMDDFEIIDFYVKALRVFLKFC